MPNWTYNTIIVEGRAEAIREFLEFVSGGAGQPFDFNKLIPMPELLRHTSTGRRSFNGEDHRAWYVIDPDLPFSDRAYEDNERPFTPQEKAALAAIGYDSWYDWSIEHWGTKWNACRVEIDDIEPLSGEPKRVSAVIRFETAWAAPLPLFQACADAFPHLEFEVCWSDEESAENSWMRVHARETAGEPA